MYSRPARDKPGANQAEAPILPMPPSPALLHFALRCPPGTVLESKQTKTQPRVKALRHVGFEISNLKFEIKRSVARRG
jgi:hypothetical protein